MGIRRLEWTWTPDMTCAKKWTTGCMTYGCQGDTSRIPALDYAHAVCATGYDVIGTRAVLVFLARFISAKAKCLLDIDGKLITSLHWGTDKNFFVKAVSVSKISHFKHVWLKFLRRDWYLSNFFRQPEQLFKKALVSPSVVSMWWVY